MATHSTGTLFFSKTSPLCRPVPMMVMNEATVMQETEKMERRVSLPKCLCRESCGRPNCNKSDRVSRADEESQTKREQGLRGRKQRR